MSRLSKLVIGCGYLGHRVAQAWVDAGDEVFALTRQQEKAQQWAAAGLQPIVADVTQPETLAALSALPELSSVLYAVGFDRQASASMRQVYVDGLSQVLQHLPAVERFIYISSTGVYGQTEGDWVDETSPCVPVRENGKVCLDAESILQAHPQLGPRSTVLRLAGIYGPGRVPHQQLVRTGEPVPVDPSGYLNLIHVDDAARVVQAAEHGPRGLYLVSDGCPVLRSDYYAELARLLHAPPPTFTPPAVDSPVANRSLASKRICNRRLLDQLPLKFLYPNFAAGLSAILQAESTGTV